MLSQFSALSLADQKAMLADQKAMLASLRSAYATNRANAKAARQAARLEKAQAKALKQEQAIVRAQLRLQKLLEKQAAPVGTKAKKAARRPSKAVVTYGAEANAIASAILAKKASAKA